MLEREFDHPYSRWAIESGEMALGERDVAAGERIIRALVAVADAYLY
jgi:hypothetical protein